MPPPPIVVNFLIKQDQVNDSLMIIADWKFQSLESRGPASCWGEVGTLRRSNATTRRLASMWPSSG